MSAGVSAIIQKENRPFGLVQNIMDIFNSPKKDYVKSVISWRTRYSMNIESIDNQHKEIFGIINNYINCILKGFGKLKTKYILDELIQSCRDHFEHEEGLMHQNEYPGLYSHKHTHKYFINELLDIRNKIDNNPFPISISTGDFIRKWTINHILTSDKAYSIFMRLRQVA
ncbi:MAG: hemerythrin family protein [Calditrichaceae bacterium]|nr:hemerythrin family protein [Calditrichaceae bacterium]